MKRKTAKTVAAGLVVSRKYWTFLQRDVLVDADARWDLLSLEAGLPTEADGEKFRGMVYDAVLAKRLAVGDVKHKVGDRERLSTVWQQPF